jgi:hypothetical protein
MMNESFRPQFGAARWERYSVAEKLGTSLARVLQVEVKFQAAIETKEVLQRIQNRLVLERAQMESELEAKIAEERRIQLQRKRKEQEQRLKDQVRSRRNTSRYHQEYTVQ